MRWDAAQIAKVARAAGFGHDDTVTATALALVTSGGLDHYDYRPGSPGSGRYVGLWGIDVDRWPWYQSRPLEVPFVAAQTAYELVRDHWGWHWSPWYVAGQWRHYIDHAGTEASRDYADQPLERSNTITTSSHRIAAAVARARALRASHHSIGR